MYSVFFRQVVVRWGWVLGALLLNSWPGRALGQESDVFIIQATMTITATDAYHKHNNPVTDRNDDFVFVFKGGQIWRLINSKWQKTESSLYNASGGGEQTVTITTYPSDPKQPPKVDVERRSWNYGTDPQQYNPAVSDLSVTFLHGYQDCVFYPSLKWPVTPAIGTPEGLLAGPGQAMGLQMLMLQGPLYAGGIHLPTNTLSYSVTQSYVTNRVIPYSDNGESGQRSANYSCSVTIQRNPPELEAVIVTKFPAPVAAPSYEEWLPLGGKDEETKGTNLLVRVELREKGAKEPSKVAKAKFHFFLQKVSREPGVCLNFPPRDHPAYQETRDVPPDLKIESVRGLTVTHEGLIADTTDSDNAFGISIASYDYGAFGTLTVTADVDGGTALNAHLKEDSTKQELLIPKDDDGNHVADAWEKDQPGLTPGLPPTWDEADLPSGHFQNGDGISLYEKYRGFMFQKIHERLDPTHKYLFVYDPSGVVIQTLAPGNRGSSFQRASSGISVRLLDQDAWTGPGSYKDQKRIVNFNTSKFGHAIDQHALHVRLDSAENPGVAKEYDDTYSGKYGTLPPNPIKKGTLGITWPDSTAPRPGGRMASPQDSLLIEVYSSRAYAAGRQTVIYNTWTSAQDEEYDAASPADRQILGEDFWADVNAYLRDRRTDVLERYWDHLSAVIVHEMGHGVGIDDLLPPNTFGPTNCLMRYLGPGDFSPDPNDRCELQRRWRSSLQPTVFCHDPAATTRFRGCYEQIQVSDRSGGMAGPASGSTLEGRTARPKSQDPVSSFTNAFIQIVETNLPVFGLGVELEWTPLLTGDPLRLTVSLRAPRWLQAMTLSLMQDASSDAGLAAPAVATNWVDGIELSLYRIDPSGTRGLVLGPNNWTPFLRPLAGDAAWTEGLLPAREREWIAAPGAADLHEGAYVLTVAWNGKGLADPGLLPENGLVLGPELAFAVGAPTTDVLKATHLRRLAFQEWDTHQDELARQDGLAAIQLDPQNASKDGVETHFVVASSELRLGQLLRAAQTIQNLTQQVPSLAGLEPGRVVADYLKALAPELVITAGATTNAPARLELLGHPGQTYVVQASTSLLEWTDLQTLTTATNRVKVLDLYWDASHRFYRARWAQ
jgi:hypothetical protein